MGSHIVTWRLGSSLGMLVNKCKQSPLPLWSDTNLRASQYALVACWAHEDWQTHESGGESKERQDLHGKQLELQSEFVHFDPGTEL